MAIEETLKKLISFKSVSGNHEEAFLQFKWIKNYLKGLPVYIREYSYDGFQSMIITTQPDTKSPKIWLAAHLDVVDGSGEVWEPKEEDGKIFGRGAFDMKFAAACYLELLKELGSNLKKYDFGIMFTTDEEIGGAHGVRTLLNDEGYRGGPVLLPDGGGVWATEEKAKGIWRFDISAPGKAAHSSRPWIGESAIAPLVKCLAELCEIGDAYITNDNEHWHLTYSITMMNGGISPNMIAASAQAMIDVRYTSNEEIQCFQSQVDDLVGKYPSLSLQTIATAELFSVDKDNEAVQLFRAIARQKIGRECGWTRAHGGSDARFFTPFDIPVVLLMIKGGEHHTEDEWVDVEDVYRFYDVMKEWALQLSKHELLPKKKERKLLDAPARSPMDAVSTKMMQYVKTGAALPGKVLKRVRSRNK